MKTKPKHPGIEFKKLFIAGRRDTSKGKIQLCDLALKSGISRQYWGEVLRGEKRVTAKLALHMERESGEPAILWAQMQAVYDVWAARQRKNYRR